MMYSSLSCKSNKRYIDLPNVHFQKPATIKNPAIDQQHNLQPTVPNNPILTKLAPHPQPKMQFTLTTVTLFLAATAAAMPTADNLERRQSGSVGLGGRCSSRNDCVGEVNCISGGGNQICSRNRGVGQPCAQNAVS
jgi:hypothetical protein